MNLLLRWDWIYYVIYVRIHYYIRILYLRIIFPCIYIMYAYMHIIMYVDIYKFESIKTKMKHTVWYPNISSSHTTCSAHVQGVSKNMPNVLLVINWTSISSKQLIRNFASIFLLSTSNVRQLKLKNPIICMAYIIDQSMTRGLSGIK